MAVGGLRVDRRGFGHEREWSLRSAHWSDVQGLMRSQGLGHGEEWSPEEILRAPATAAESATLVERDGRVEKRGSAQFKVRATARPRVTFHLLEQQPGISQPAHTWNDGHA